MLLKDYMELVAAAEATGEYAGRDMILAVDCTENGDAANPGDYTFVGVHIEDVGASIKTRSEDKSYVLEGDSTIKTGAQRIFAVEGTRFVSDAFQDFCCGVGVKFGLGTAVQRRYVYFHSGTRTGEAGKVTILVEKDGGASASDPAEFSAELRACGRPEGYTYTAEG